MQASVKPLFVKDNGATRAIKYRSDSAIFAHAQKYTALKGALCLITVLFSLNAFAQDYYITTSDLNLRAGAGVNYKSSTVISKGDTVRSLEGTSGYWVRIQHHGNVGYSAKQYLQKIQIDKAGQEREIEEESESGSFSLFLIGAAIFVIGVLIQVGRNYKRIKRQKRKRVKQPIYQREKWQAIKNYARAGSQIHLIVERKNFDRIQNQLSMAGCHNITPISDKRINQDIPYLDSWIKSEYNTEWETYLVPYLYNLDYYLKLIRLRGKVKVLCYSQIESHEHVTHDNHKNTSSDETLIDVNSEKLDLTIKPSIQNDETQLEPPPREHVTHDNHKNTSSDETLIDVDSEKLDLTIKPLIQNDETQLEPPYWSHTYVHSYDEINRASKAQKEFYFHLRENVLNGEFVDIRGNTNYAFILYFDLLNQYETHQDIELLEEQFKLLGQVCPKTKSYSSMSLQGLLRKRTDSHSIDKLNALQKPSYQLEHGHSDYDPDAYKLGKHYKDKLGLSKQEAAWLNKFWNHSNIFTSIEGCCIATIKQYILILKRLNKELELQNTSIAKEVDYFKEKIFEVKEFADPYYGKSYMKRRVESEIYLTIFKRVENAVREFYGHKRKVGRNPHYEFDGQFEGRIGNRVDELITQYQGEILPPDIETQIELNAENVNRWKIEFTALKNQFQKEEKSKFIDGIRNIEKTNQKNRNIENIFIEASKLIAKYDRVQSLKYYAQYIYYDLKSNKFDNKPLTQAVQKSLFKTQGQIDDFKRIIAELIQTSDIDKALHEIARIYMPKRKKIVLDKSAIKEAEQKYDDTVELLNEYLDVESEKTNIGNLENEEVEVVPMANNSILISEIRLGKPQEELIKKITTHSFEILQGEVDRFAIENRMFKNQLIDSINEACEAFLDGEALIEEDGENYVIEESYYKAIAV